MQLGQLETFCRVVETGGFSAAAAVLHVTQPAVSLQVRALERELGTVLLERGGGVVRLTEAGRRLYPHARVMLLERDAALSELADLAGRPLLLGASSTGVAYYLPPLLERFQQEVVTRVDITDRVLDWVAEGVVDLGIVWGPVRGRALASRVLGADRFCVVCQPTDPLARIPGREVEPAELTDRPFVLGTPDSLTRTFIEGCLAEAGIRPRLAAEVASTADMKRAVEDGLGLAVVSRRAAREEFVSGRLVELDIPALAPLLWRQVCLVWQRGVPQRPEAAALGAFLVATLRLPEPAGRR